MMIRDAWHWYRQYPALWLYLALRWVGAPLRVQLWPVPWFGVAWCGNTFAEYREFVRSAGDDGR